MDYGSPKEYEIGGITVTGIKYLDAGVLRTLSGLEVGDKINVPGEKFSKAIENLWKQGLLSDIKIEAAKIEGNLIFINLALQERPRLSRFTFKGVGKSEADDIREQINLSAGKIITDDLLRTTEYKVKMYFIDKGFLNNTVKTEVFNDSTMVNSQYILIEVMKGKKVRVKNISIEGNTALKEKKLQRSMKGTKEKRWYKIFTSSKYNEEIFEEDKLKLEAKYLEKGYRDARIVFDTVYPVNRKFVNIDITLSEGKQYHFRNITWIGNTKYTSQQLDAILGIKKGDIYNQKKLEEGLYMNQSGRDVTSLYMDDGYLFFQIDPIEVLVSNDSIDIEMRLYEGKQARVNRVTVVGNTKTNDHVIMREVRTMPGQLFSRSDIIRTQREFAQLGYFDPEKLGVNPKPNPADGTVDIEYVVEEKPSDQLELSGGWGGGQVVGTLGVRFTNFSAKNIFNRESYNPLPSGDGQQLSLRAQSSGPGYQSYNISFVEPWLGGKRPNSFSVSAYHSIQSNGRKRSDELRQAIIINGVSVGFGRRIRWPDDYFSLFHEVSFQNYNLDNYLSTFLFSQGYSNNLSFSTTLSRSSIDQPVFTKTGSQLSLSLQLTPPYSAFTNKNYGELEAKEKYKWIEYYKIKYSASWFNPLAAKFVLHAKAQFGFLGYYNKGIGQSPFERFYLGGDGLYGFSLDGREIIALRGYENNSLTPGTSAGNYIGGTIYDKFTMELRYPISLNPNATIYALAFIEGGDSYLKFRDFNPFELKRSAGVGIRFFLPMFGLIGLDYGYGFDRDKIQFPVSGETSKGQIHFMLGQQF